MNAEQWKDVPTDPDPETDLGYEAEELTVVQSSADSQVIVLPEDEAQIGKEEFIVIDEESFREIER